MLPWGTPFLHTVGSCAQLARSGSVSRRPSMRRILVTNVTGRFAAVSLHACDMPWGWWRERDSNPRPPGYEPGELPTALSRVIAGFTYRCCKGSPSRASTSRDAAPGWRPGPSRLSCSVFLALFLGAEARPGQQGWAGLAGAARIEHAVTVLETVGLPLTDTPLLPACRAGSAARD